MNKSIKTGKSQAASSYRSALKPAKKRAIKSATKSNESRATKTVALHSQWSDPDGFYEALLDAHEGLSLDASTALNARLILILANQIADQALLVQCLELAKA